MDHILLTISGFSVSIAAIAGCFRYKKVDSRYHPIIWLMWIALINETINYFFLRSGTPNSVNSNIYSLVESGLITLFFRRVGLFDKWKPLAYVFAGLFISVWIADNFIISSIHQFNSYFTIVVSFSYVLMSVTMINRLIVSQVKTLTRNSVFLISIGFVVFYTYAVLVEIFWIYGLHSSNDFLRNLYRIMILINLAVNLIYALAIIWMPGKRKYILL
jgi:hypothetical protein